MALDEQALRPLLDYVREQRGIDFGSYKTSSLQRRLGKRMQAVGATDPAAYLDYLQASPDEFTPLIDTLLINVTQFFRDGDAWETLRELVLPRILERRTGADTIRVWCAGISGGDEAFTIAMLLAEELGIQHFRDRVKIYATDVDDGELAIARVATYTARQLEGVPEPLRDRYFEPNGGDFTFRQELRRPMIFGRHNLLEDAPISRLDLLICRNTLIYFNREAQNRVLARFHFGLRDHGFLFLGRSEMLLTRRNLFAPVDGRARIFSKLPRNAVRDRLALLTQAGDGSPDHDTTTHANRLRDLAFDHSPMPQVVVDVNGLLVVCNNAARAQFSITHHHIGRPFQDHELSYRPIELRSRIERAFAENKPLIERGVERPFHDGSTYLDIRIAPIADVNGAPIAAVVSFTDITSDRDLRLQLEESRNELETAYEELQSTNEELETTNEELQSTVEELETTNEELQSTNEELETMNEELQSSNEEIRSVNDELRDRTDAVARLNAYMRSILNSVKPGVIVLDEKLHVHIWNAQAAELWGLRPDEVEDQAFLNLDIGLPVHHLRDALRRSLRGESDGEVVHLSAHNRRGRGIQCRVTCSPLLGPDGSVSGVILMMEDPAGKPGPD